MTVHDLARLAGIAPHVVRYYTQRGLLEPQRNTRNGYREYRESDVYRLQFICRAKTVGFTLTDIKLILGDADRGVAPCPQVRQLVQLRARQNEQAFAEAQRLQEEARQAARAEENESN